MPVTCSESAWPCLARWPCLKPSPPVTILFLDSDPCGECLYSWEEVLWHVLLLSQPTDRCENQEQVFPFLSSPSLGPPHTTHILLNGRAFQANCNQFECLARKTWCCDGIPEPAEMYFWLETALDTLYNGAECLTSGANTPVPSDWPSAQGRRYYASPGRGWLPNNPEAQASLLRWRKLPAAGSTELLLGFCYRPCSEFSFTCRLSHQDQQTSRQGSLASLPVAWYPRPTFYVSRLFP